MARLVRQSLNIQLFRRCAQFPELSASRREQSTEKTCEAANHYDVIIVGGGMVGTTMACAIGKSSKMASKKVLLLEGAPAFKGFSADKYSNRVSTLSKGSRKLLTELDVWSEIEAVRCKYVKEMQVWDASSNAHINFTGDHPSDELAYVVENDLVLDSVYKQLATNERVVIKNDSRIGEVQLNRDGVPMSVVRLKSGEQFTCNLLIGADGANSIVRRQMNETNFSLAYNQMGVVATLHLEQLGDNSTAWQRFLPSGLVAMLPLTDTISSLVWSTTPAHAKDLVHMADDEFVRALNSAFNSNYAQEELVTGAMRALESLLGTGAGAARKFPPAVVGVAEKSRAAFPLGFGHASTYIGRGVALIGDAAHRIHPLAGQGVNLGFGDVASLGGHLADASYNGAALGDPFYLMKYERDRLKHNVPIMVGVHGLQRLYGTNLSPVVALRSLGLRLTNACPPLKKIFMERAMA